ncbi:hypothetical protein LY474_25770 [Myxococcus stipitatus]|uniref:glycosyltransferase n=1 Tax=Myxococcus stipitatus TaxID=83455 RepID=UPI001F34DB0B|nr:hypothetical protein [Myxococcus stipitatus]MCE9671223.1 hypothetical protein [Myxococcus stipitatus]
MAGEVKLFLEEEPFGGAPGAINAVLQDELKRLGYATTTFYRQRIGVADKRVPLASADRIRRLTAEPPVDLAVYCDLALGIRPPSRAIAHRNLVLFHGLIGSPGVWIDNPVIDRYWALSPYVQRVITSLLTLPDWRRRRCLDARGFTRVEALAAPLPCVEAPDGHPGMTGGPLPDYVRRAAETSVLVHAVQASKPDWNAVFRILLQLHQHAREQGDARRFRLVVFAEDFAYLHHSLLQGYPLDVTVPREVLTTLGCRLDELLIPVPHMSQTALFELFRVCRLGLAYNTIPEAFGCYVLESVFNGCPVFTNGIGNNRFNLPPDHGIHVVEDVDIAFGVPGSHARVAERILRALREPDATREACQRGREYVQRTYTRAAFGRGIQQSLEQLEHEPEPPAFDTLRIEIGPLVRHLDPETGRVASDFQNLVLERAEVECLERVLHRTVNEVAPPGDEAGLARLQSLFSRGVLTLVPSAAS